MFSGKKPKCVYCKKNPPDEEMKDEANPELVKFLQGFHINPKNLCKECLISLGELEIKCHKSPSIAIIKGPSLQKLFKEFLEKINQ